VFRRGKCIIISTDRIIAVFMQSGGGIYVSGSGRGDITLSDITLSEGAVISGCSTERVRAFKRISYAQLNYFVHPL